jgi:hypothetical protein
MAIERVLVTIKGESGEKKWRGAGGVCGGGERIMATKRFLVTIRAW